MPIKAPARIYTAMEGRAAFEYLAWSTSRRFLSMLPKGDGHPVLVLPGFTAADGSTFELRAFLRRLGYRTYGWKLGTNLGPTPTIVEGLEQRLLEVSAKEHGAPVTVIGWSLGGIYARDLAERHPDLVRQVITMGSPFRMMPGDPSAAAGLWEQLQPLHDKATIERLAEREVGRLPVPSTAVYTRSDGVVHWSTCIEERSETSESVEVFGSHCGLGFNPSVAIVVADRLAQPAGEWTRFRPKLWARGWFPPAAHWRQR